MTTYAGDGVISEDAVLSMASEHATIAERCTCAISDDKTERGVPQLRVIPLVSLQRVEWAYPYGSEEPYVKLSDLDRISRASPRASAATEGPPTVWTGLMAGFAPAPTDRSTTNSGDTGGPT